MGDFHYSSPLLQVSQRSSLFPEHRNIITDLGQFGNNKNDILNCSSLGGPGQLGEEGKKQSNDAVGHPNQEDLNKAFKSLSEHIPNLFVHPMDYSIFHPQVITENNINGKRTE